MSEKAANAGMQPRAACSWRAHPFLRFVVVGGVGFLVDASALILLVRFVGINPLAARALSFSVAVLATFELNRRWSFRGRGSHAYGAALARYLGVQGVGFLTNFFVYSALYLMAKAPFDRPLVCLAVASLIALLVNYSGANHLVFRQKASP